MWAWLRTRWESVVTSLWFIPVIMAAASIVTAIVVLRVEVEIEGNRPWWIHSGSSSGAVTLLASLLGALITMATLAVSITMVVLSMAASHLGPRLIRMFMANKRTQIALGFFLGTIVYIVLVLRTLRDGMTDDQAPHLAISVGTLLTIACVFVLLFFVHHLGRSIVSDNVIHRVGTALDQAAETLLPEKAGAVEARVPPRTAESATFCLPRSGYVQAIDYEAIAEHARRCDAFVELSFRPGHYVLDGLEHVRMSPSAALTDEVKRNVSACVALGPERTAHQDLEYSVRQLVEIALRALSPGINDTYTALAVIDRLSGFLARVMDRGEPSGAWQDCDGVPRVFGPVSDFDGVVDAALNQIRQAGAGNAAVLIRLAERLGQLQNRARTDRQRAHFERHAQLVAAVARRSVHEKSDLDACLGRAPAPFE